MGLYDCVNYKCACPRCGGLVEGFQTKSGDNLLKTVEPTTIGNFYSTCTHCKLWLEFSASLVSEFKLTVLEASGAKVEAYSAIIKVKEPE